MTANNSKTVFRKHN